MEEDAEMKVENRKEENNNTNKSCFDSCVPKSWLEEGSFWNHPAGKCVVIA